MVARGPHQGEAVVRLAGHDRIDQRQETSAGQQRRLPGARRHRGVGVKSLRPAAGSARHPLQVLLSVHQRQLVGGRRPRFDADEAGAIQPFDEVTEDRDTLRTFWVPVPGLVLLVPLVDHHRGSQHGDPPSRRALPALAAPTFIDAAG